MIDRVPRATANTSPNYRVVSGHRNNGVLKCALLPLSQDIRRRSRYPERTAGGPHGGWGHGVDYTPVILSFVDCTKLSGQDN